MLTTLMAALSAVAAVAAVAPGACPRLAPIPGRGLFKDLCTGRQIVVHGVNAVYKAEPWLAPAGEFSARYSLGPEDAEILQSWGMNGVRLGVMWPGAMPTRNVVDQEYLDKARATTELLAARGVYSLLDAHQDLLSAKYCGEGAPDWAMPQIFTGPDALPAPFGPAFNMNASGVPSAEDCAKYNWVDYQLTVAGSRGYQSLYDNKNGTAESFAQFWSAVGKTFVNASHIIGAEIINEPFAGAIYDDPLLLVPGVADRENLQPLYKRVAAALQAADPDLAVHFESVTWDDFVPVGFNSTPTADASRSALSFHYYHLPNFNADVQMASRLDDAKRLGCGAFLTEFNIGDGALSPNALNETLVVADQHSMSWLAWEYKPMVEITGWGWGPINPNGTRNDAEVTLLARPYPQSTCGDVRSWRFDDATRVFSFAFAPATGCGDTEVYLNCDLHYPGCSPTVEVTTGASAVTTTLEAAPRPTSSRATQWATLRVALRPGMAAPPVVELTMRP